MRWVGVVTALSIGCAGSATPRIATPERCSCERKAWSEKPTTMASVPGKALAPAVPFVNAPTLEGTQHSAELDYELRRGGGADAIAKNTKAACAKLGPEVNPAIATLEPEVLRRTHEAREIRTHDDGTSTKAERDLAAWSAYDTALDNIRVKLAPMITAAVDDVVLREPGVTKALTTAVEEVFGSVNPYPELPKDLFIEKARRRARFVFREHLDDASVTCALAIVDRERGRWVAIFNGKL